MADLSLSVTQLQALHTLLLLQGSNLPDDLKSLPASLQAQLALNSTAPSFPTPSPSPERLPRTGSISLAGARLRPHWLFSQPRATCEVGTQVEDPALALESFSRPSSSASGAGYGAGSEVEEDLDGISAHNASRDSAHNPTRNPSCDSASNPIYDSAHASDPDSIHDSFHDSIHDCDCDRDSIHGRDHNSIHNCDCDSICDCDHDHDSIHSCDHNSVKIM
ncbi:MAG: hypothetical protein NXY57DRAFT_979276 [Lentinula lateritia]|nr:MAG: hypothetical protein NXY57DRAFT_979276 [Lentinula lateritia]